MSSPFGKSVGVFGFGAYGETERDFDEFLSEIC